MPRKLSVVVVVLCLCAGVRAQIVTDDAVTTDSVDLFAEPPAEQKQKSAAFAMVQSLVMPGLGQQYLGIRQRAALYFATEALFVFGAILAESYSRRMFEDARTVAWINAGARGGPGADEQYWRDVGLYLDSRGYNDIQELNRTPEHKYVEQHLQWAWVDDEYREEYLDKRKDATNFHVASTLFAGAMILNRVVSFVDARIATLRRRRTTVSSLRLQPRMSPDLSTVAVTVSGDF